MTHTDATRVQQEGRQVPDSFDNVVITESALGRDDRITILVLGTLYVKRNNVDTITYTDFSATLKRQYQIEIAQAGARGDEDGYIPKVEFDVDPLPFKIN